MDHQRPNSASSRTVWLQGAPLLLTGILLLLIASVAMIVYFDHRLDQAEERMMYVPPRNWEAPVLEDYPCGDVDTDALPVRQLVYVPVYSHVYYHGGVPYPLETTLSIRNIDSDQPIYLSSVLYFDTSGHLARTHLDQTIRLAPLQTIEFLVEREDSSGGSGANFLVEWRGHPDNDRPLVEAVMVGTAGYQGICFSRTGIEISQPVERPADAASP